MDEPQNDDLLVAIKGARKLSEKELRALRSVIGKDVLWPGLIAASGADLHANGSIIESLDAVVLAARDAGRYESALYVISSAYRYEPGDMREAVRRALIGCGMVSEHER